MSLLTILNVDHVAPPPGPYPAPGDTVPLSFFDSLWVVLPPVQLLFLYPGPSLPPLSSVVPSLKSSLSKTLLEFHSLAGKLTYHPSSGDVTVDCTRPALGAVAFLEAECGADAERLAGDPVHDVEAFEKLVPELDVKVLPAAALAVQVTEFVGGGVAVGVAFHHAVVDGRGIWQFLDAWSANCRGAGECRAPIGPGPVNDRAVIRRRGGTDEVARRFVRELGPALPNTMITTLPVHDRPQLVRRTFTVSTPAIQSIKQRIMNQTNHMNLITTPPSRFVALAAHIWVSIARARAILTDDISTFAFTVDCRPHLDPPVDDAYTGNCARPQYARIQWSKLHTEHGLAHACVAIKRAIREGVDEPLRGHEEWAKEFLTLPPMSERWFVGMSPRFMAYETDFGWGRPKRVEVVSILVDGEVELLNGGGEGEMQASAALSPLHMDRFVEVFVGGFGSKESEISSSAASLQEYFTLEQRVPSSSPPPPPSLSSLSSLGVALPIIMQ